VKSKPLIPYVRRSRKDEEVVSLGDQREAISEWAERNNVALTEPLVEKESGNKPWREREIGEAIARCERGEAAGVVVAYRSRLSREKLSATYEVIEELQPYRLVVVKSNRDLAPGVDKTKDLIDVIEGWQARDEWLTLSGHLSSGKHHTWENGAVVGDRVPAGYEMPLVPDKRGNLRPLGPLQKTEHADVIGQALTARAGGASWSEVARILTDAGVPTSKGDTRWSTQACRALARNPIYKGEHRCTCGCGEVRMRPELAVVTPSVWTKAQPVKGNGKGRKDPGRFLLSGLLYCRGCGRRMTRNSTTINGKTYSTYRCSTTGGQECAGRAAVSADKIEALLMETAVEAARGAFMDPTISIGHDTNIEVLAQLEHERDEAQARHAAFIDGADPLDPGYKERNVELREAVQAAEAALLAESQARSVNLDADQVKALLRETATVDEKRRFLRLVMRGAIVTAARDRKQPVEDRVEIDWVTYTGQPAAA